MLGYVTFQHICWTKNGMLASCMLLFPWENCEYNSFTAFQKSRYHYRLLANGNPIYGKHSVFQTSATDFLDILWSLKISLRCTISKLRWWWHIWNQCFVHYFCLKSLTCYSRSHHHLQISAIQSHLDGGIYNSKNKEICTLCNLSSSRTYKLRK